ncbi:hypothetical protein NPIL_498031 [Nephila pilipes]|uniref:Uncharacterized protein n=1 Tax=Nephila pilipes TaxID=299642 RepID=A0A8X6MXX4_NEPPI|nr:hypothetical protein NPIL_498031 [Nephila pilipes]
MNLGSIFDAINISEAEKQNNAVIECELSLVREAKGYSELTVKVVSTSRHSSSDFIHGPPRIRADCKDDDHGEAIVSHIEQYGKLVII